MQVTDHVDFDFTTNFAVEFSMKTSSLGQGSDRYVIDKGNAYSLRYNQFSTTSHTIAWSGGGLSGAALSLPDQAWHHVVYSYDGSALRAYRDGVLVAINSAAGATRPTRPQSASAASSSAPASTLQSTRWRSTRGTR